MISYKGKDLLEDQKSDGLILMIRTCVSPNPWRKKKTSLFRVHLLRLQKVVLVCLPVSTTCQGQSSSNVESTNTTEDDSYGVNEEATDEKV